MPAKVTEAAWSVIDRVLRKRPHLLQGQHVWIPQPEANPEFFDLLGTLTHAKKEIYQSFKPEVNAINAKGIKTQNTVGGGFDLALCVPTRQRVESLGLIAHALLHSIPESQILFVCPNNLGAGGFLTRLEEAMTEFEADSAQKCRWALLSPLKAKREVLETWIEAAKSVTVPGTELQSLPGIFGWNKIDRGSELLLQTLPALSGKGGDLGSGYGYLSAEILKKNADIKKLHLLEADARALDCARFNLQPYGERCAYHWIDVTAAEARGFATDLDWIVMNPPFHEGATQSTEVGKLFIESAASKLVAGGHLYMVANAFLPYEEKLSQRFKKFSTIHTQDGFKVIHAQR